ncbi:unnamed protein product [Chironomus riparius]|uniref:Uncharacterized protein n=1 Tax=Chironomus riparius TaxID=315576 RepID=A0A9N9S4J0_9DIPT|nr:unnamed protein product [Chironomus riparius]
MSKSKRNNQDDMNNLNVNLKGALNGDKLGDTEINIPFADEETPQVKHKTQNVINSSNESISSNDSDTRAQMYKRSISARKGANLRIQIDNASSSDDEADNKSLESEKRDKPGPLISDLVKTVSEAPAVGLRRNSFSMPALNEIDLDALRSLHMQAVDDEHDDDTDDFDPMKSKESLSEIHVLDDGASMVCSIAEPESEKENKKTDDSDSDSDHPMVSRSKFRTRRRGSIAPLPAIRLNDKEIMANAEYDVQSMISAAPSITSVSSLASLLKEKMQGIPSMLRKRKKPKDYKIRIFTALLFLMIIFLVGYAYVMYNHKVTSKMYFEHIKFSSGKRQLFVSDTNGSNVLSGSLGTTIHIPKAYLCRDIVTDEKENVCWEWSKLAKLHISLDKKFRGNSSPKEYPTSRCYNFRWESLSENFHPTDCFKIGSDLGQWYGGGVTKNAEWLLEKNAFNFTPFITGDVRHHEWGNALNRYFINSLGIAIEVDEKTPLHISINPTNNSQLCIKSEYDDFAYNNHPTTLPVLEYRICTANDMKILHHNLTQKHLWDGLKQQEIDLIKAIFDEPVWEVSGDLSDVAISNVTDSIIALGYFRLGHVLLNEQWQRYVGDFEVDEERFTALDDIINVLHRRGFRISLTIQPFVSTESKTFAELVQKKLLIYERSTDRTIPALTKFKSSRSDGVLDITNNETIPWLLNKLEIVKKKYQIDSFYLEFGNAYDMPKFYDSSEALLNPDQYKSIFMDNITSSLTLLGVSGAISVPRPPAFLSLPQVNSTWHGLKTVLTSIINYGIIGYPFLMPNAVGGDFIVEQNGSNLPELELYIRWLQLATFLPVLRFKYLPSDYKNENLTEIAKDLALIRQKTVKQVYEKYLNDAMNEGLPLVRPLWMLDPSDAACMSVVDEFSVGEQIIVAPIIEKGVTTREVYLPEGVWKDGIDGSLRKGSRWIHNYRVMENQIAYFVKMPDNTRF